MNDGEQKDKSHLGELLNTFEVLKFLGTNEATFNNWKAHKIYIPHEGGDDGRANLYYIKCLKVRYGVFDNLKRRKHPPKFIQRTIGEIFTEKFGADDNLLMEGLREKTPEEIIGIVIEQSIKIQTGITNV